MFINHIISCALITRARQTLRHGHCSLILLMGHTCCLLGYLGAAAFLYRCQQVGIWGYFWERTVLSQVDSAAKPPPHHHSSAFPIVEVWGGMLRNRCLVFHTDNSAVVAVVNKLSCKEPTVMRLIRRLVVQSLPFNIRFKCQHIPGVLNVLADHLSRLQVDTFRRLAPHMNHQPTPIGPTSSLVNTLMETVQCLLETAIAPQTRRTYVRAFQLLKQLVSSTFQIDNTLPVSVYTLTFFIAYLHRKQMTSSTICTYVTAIHIYIYTGIGHNLFVQPASSSLIDPIHAIKYCNIASFS